MATEQFLWRHVGPRPEDIEEMLGVIGVKSVDELIGQTVPESIRLKKVLDLPAPLTESNFWHGSKQLLQKIRFTVRLSGRDTMIQFLRR